MRPAPSITLVAAALSLTAGGCLEGSARDYVRDNYRPERQAPGKGGPAAYHSDSPPSRTAAEIGGAIKPGERRNTQSGIFLRYSEDVVGVVPDGRGGSTILVDDERRGYAHFYPYVGGYWGSYSGPAETFRGGGPAAGK